MAAEPLNRVRCLTATGSAAIAVFELKGPDARAAIESHFLPKFRLDILRTQPHAIVFGHWCYDGQYPDRQEDVVVIQTAPECFEVHLHGGNQSQSNLLANLATAGFETRDLNGFSARRIEKEFVRSWWIALTAAESEMTFRWLLDQPANWMAFCDRALAWMERDRWTELEFELQSMARRSRVAIHLIKPWQVVLYGRPNVGKSSLLNALAGFARAVVHESPGTTRDVVSEKLFFEGWPMEIADTAGMRTPSCEVERQGIEKAIAFGAQADLRIWVSDASDPSSAVVPPSVAHLEPHLFVINKGDLIPQAAWPTPAIVVSARQGWGLDRLVKALVAAIVPESPEREKPLPFSPELREFVTFAEDAVRRRDRISLQKRFAALKADVEL